MKGNIIDEYLQIKMMMIVMIVVVVVLMMICYLDLFAFVDFKDGLDNLTLLHQKVHTVTVTVTWVNCVIYKQCKDSFISWRFKHPFLLFGHNIIENRAI